MDMNAVLGIIVVMYIAGCVGYTTGCILCGLIEIFWPPGGRKIDPDKRIW